MPVKRPTPEQIVEVGAQLGMRLSNDEAAQYHAAMQPMLAGYDAVDAMADELPEVRYPRVPGYRATGDENPHNGWYWKTAIKGTAEGKLAGKKVGIKDNICVAGVPMMNGASVLEGYVPEVDATVVGRILDAGGEIAGKTACEYLCFSGGSHTNATGLPVHNPWKRGHTSGGSSSGSGAVVAAGDVEMAIGGDQGGSIRIPASMCGIVGLKPTHGLVPYTGVMPIELTIDHIGPMTDTVANNALLLEVIAGADGLDPRQKGVPENPSYAHALEQGAEGLTIGVVTEGFGHPNSEPAVDETVRAAIAQLDAIGASVREISIPEHLVGGAVWTPIGLEGTVDLMMNGNGFGTNWKGLYITSLIDRYARCARAGGRVPPYAEVRNPPRPVHAEPVWRPLLRQGAEYRPAHPRGLRPRTRGVRRDRHADDSDCRDADTAGGRAHRRLHPARPRDVDQHRHLQCHRSPIACRSLRLA